MSKNANLLPLLQSLDGSIVNGIKLGISHLDSRALHAAQSGFAILLIEVVALYFNNL